MSHLLSYRIFFYLNPALHLLKRNLQLRLRIQQQMSLSCIDLKNLPHLVLYIIPLLSILQQSPPTALDQLNSELYLQNSI